MADTGRTVFADGLWADDLFAAGLWAIGEAVVVPDVASSGGWGFWPEFDRFAADRRRRKREQEEREAEAKAIQDELDRQIAEELRAQEARDADRADLERLQKLADRFAGTSMPDLPKKARVAILNAQDARTRNSLEQMQRELSRAMEDEEMAFILTLLMLD